jgi:hypothetical protein
MGDLQSPAPALSVSPHISGVVHGGQSPISGATIQMYSLNTTTNAGASASMLISPVTTGSDGSFIITSDYPCPSSHPLVYLVSTGGNPGMGGSVNNTDIVLMAALGTCDTLSSSTVIMINELTTVAAVQALATFMTDATHIGSASTNLLSIAGQFNQANQSITQSTGLYGSAVSVTELQLTTWANILAACVNTTGGTSGDGTPCGKLLQLAGGGSTDTVTAALHMVQSPANNAAALYGLIVATAPFQPYFSSVPSDLTVSVGFPIPPNIRAFTLDSNGHIWAYTGGYSYATATNTSTDLQGIVTVYDNNFNQLFTISTGTPGPGGLYYPVSMIPDSHGHVFAMNANNTVSEFDSGGTALSPSGGWSTGVATTFNGTSSGNNYVTNSTQVQAVRVDSAGNIWGATSTAANCYVEMNSAGAVITPAGTYCLTAGSLSQIVPDGSGSAWTLSNTAISKVNAAGSLAATAPNSSGCFYPFFTAFTGNPTAAPYVSTISLAYDYVHSQVWAHSITGAGTITDGGTGVFCDSTSSTLPVIPPFASSSTTPGDPYSAGSLLLLSGALDGAGNFWFITGGYSASGVVGGSSGTFTGPTSFSTYLGELSPTGAVLTPFNTSTQTYGLQPSGVGANVTATSTNGSVSPISISAALLGVDVSGNIWMEDILSNRIIKISGAVANTVNY